eukprot:3025708-Pleurochrysis_carterae.AAC.1
MSRRRSPMANVKAYSVITEVEPALPVYASPPTAPREALSSTFPGPCVGGGGCRDSDGKLHPPHGEPFPASAAPP